MNSFIRILLILFVVNQLVYSQMDSVTCDNIEVNLIDYIKQTYRNQLRGSRYLLVSNEEDKCILIVEKDSSCLVEYDFTVNLNSRIITCNGITTFSCEDQVNLFDTTKYHRGYIDMNSNFYKDGYNEGWGRILYIVYVNKYGVNLAESRLPFLVSPNPIDRRIYNILMKRYFRLL